MRNGHKLNQKHIRKVGGSSGSEVYKSTEGNKTIITYGECNISPSKFECDFKCGGWGALAQSSVTFTVQGYKNNSWVTIFEKNYLRVQIMKVMYMQSFEYIRLKYYYISMLFRLYKTEIMNL